MSVLLIAEFDQQSLKAATRSAITAATQLGGDLDVLVIGHNVNAIAQQVAKVQGVTRVLVADDAAYAKPLAENFAPLVQGIAARYSHILAAASSFGKNLVPRVAALLDVDMVSEVTKIIDASTYVRPLYAGNLNATVQTSEVIKLLTVRPTGFTAAKDGEQAAPIEAIATLGDQSLSRFVSENIQVSERPELGTASVIVTGGRSLGSAEKFEALMSPLANKLNAAIGATRAAVDAGFAPNEWQVGQTGTVVAPDVYIAIGVSGAAQHIAGMKESRLIIAINQDPDAQIFQWSDYGLVADLFDAVPKISAAL
ncbi:electron transfer flavoprotein subunit beta [Cellvibrio zantedeschiae]|uniref:Electron transfer flavoprotein subunit beta n=1 Tax=Cellvibrio zantedeschiae TaxID=1237077 RepID=A0ABQ3AWX5_9GAMM|nr:FAD-binding protein [Cellvibrio zantedeschiae]GGY69932.1 electron transfer flavoprotein subunit beta [Cellvibrio zantedeschiae]